MSFAKVYSAQPVFLNAQLVTIEVDLSRGLHSFTVVGLPDKAVEESRDRVAAAIKNSGFTSPKSTNQKIVVSLAPADVRKEGPRFDLGIALSYLAATKGVSFDSEKKLFIGELTLDGNLRPTTGTLSVVREAKKKGFHEVFLPKENAEEAALVDGITIYGANSLLEIINHIDTNREEHQPLSPQEQTKVSYTQPEYAINFDDVRGQETAKRGLEIAAAGRHNIVLYGPPGTGKTMLARALTTILPPLSFPEALEVTAIHSVAGVLSESLVTHPPFRSPHHTASYVSLVGGGMFPKPGEITLAHRGVLFLDEFPELERRCIDSLRQPLEDKVITVSRAKGTMTFPTNFILVAAMNPTPGGEQSGAVTPSEQARYQKKVSGPITDRIDMWIEMPHIEFEKLSERSKTTGETDRLRKKVRDARALQQKRFSDVVKTNSDMSVRDIDETITLSKEVRTLLNTSARKLSMSPRAYHRSIKLARTIADLEGSEEILEEHVLEAFQYRPRNISE